MQTFIVILNFIVSPSVAILLYFVIRTHLWRQYYRHTKHCPVPASIDRGDKLLAMQFALVLGAVWPVSLTAYLIWRHRVMTKRRVIAGRYADVMMHRFDAEHVNDESYVEELDESRRDH